MIFGCAVFVAACVGMITGDVPDPGRYNDTSLLLIGISGLVLSSSAGLWAVTQWLDRRPGLIVDEQGITDQSSILGVGHIPWSSVINIELRSVWSTRSIFIYVTNPEQCIERMRPNWKQHWLKRTEVSHGTPIKLSTNTLKCDFDELYRFLLEEAEKRGVFADRGLTTDGTYS